MLPEDILALAHVKQGVSEKKTNWWPKTGLLRSVQYVQSLKERRILRQKFTSTSVQCLRQVTRDREHKCSLCVSLSLEVCCKGICSGSLYLHNTQLTELFSRRISEF